MMIHLLCRKWIDWHREDDVQGPPPPLKENSFWWLMFAPLYQSLGHLKK